MSFKPIHRMMHSRYNCIMCLGNYLAYLYQYRNLFLSIVKKEFKGRFKYTTLGYLWNIINPLFQIVSYLLIFTVIFGKDIPNYWVYTSTGMFAFIFSSNCIMKGSKAIISNANIVTKMTFPREVLVVSVTASNLITLSISYVILFIIMIIARVPIHYPIMLVPLLIITLAIFSTGVAFALSAICVYVRDVVNAVSLVMGVMLFAIPVMYVTSQRATPFMEFIWSINPLYYYMQCIHSTFYAGLMPDLFELVMCIIIAPISFIVGLLIFKKLESGFVECL